MSFGRQEACREHPGSGQCRELVKQPPGSARELTQGPTSLTVHTRPGRGRAERTALNTLLGQGRPWGAARWAALYSVPHGGVLKIICL